MTSYLTWPMCRKAHEAPYSFVLFPQGSGMRFGHSGQYWKEDARNLIAINMTESGWRHLDGSTSPRDTLVPQEEFMIVLARINRLLLRASYHMYQTEAQLVWARSLTHPYHMMFYIQCMLIIMFYI